MSLGNWKVTDSTYALKDRWITVRVDTCRTPEGDIVSPYYVLEYPKWVNIVALTPDNHVILTRQYRHGLGHVVTEIPCGTMEKADISPLDAIKRELLEETGYSCDTYIELGKVSPNSANHNNLTYSYLGLNARRVRAPQKDDNENIEVFTEPVGRLPKMVITGVILQSLHISAIYLALEKLKALPE